MTRVVVLGEVAVDHIGADVRIGGAGYAARAAAVTGAEVALGGPVGSDVPAAELERLRRLRIDFGDPLAGASRRYVMRRTGAAEQRITTPIEGTFEPQIRAQSADAYLLFASRGLDLNEAMAVAKKQGARTFVDGHRDELADDRWVDVLRECDVLFINLHDAIARTAGNPMQIAKVLGRVDKVTVIKHGRGGLTALTPEGPLEIGAFECKLKNKVGAGDTLVGVTAALLAGGTDLRTALTRGAAAVAWLVETGGLPYPPHVDEAMRRPQTYVAPDRFLRPIYVASPFFTRAERLALETVEQALRGAQLRIWSPSREVGMLDATAGDAERQRFFRADLEALEATPLLVAILDADDPGTAWEVGYAYARKKPIFGLRTDERARPNNMLAQSIAVVPDLDELLTSVFRALSLTPD